MRYARTYTSLRAADDKSTSLWPLVRAGLAVAGAIGLWAILHAIVVGPVGPL